MKGSGSCSMESLHSALVGHLLSAKSIGFVMIWDWDSGEIAGEIDVDVKNVGFL